MVEFREKAETATPDECVHEYAVIGQVELKDGFGYLFYCKYCLDVQMRAVGGQDETANKH